jgi:hypothetical protein
MTPMYGGNLTFNYHQSFVELQVACRTVGINFGATNVVNESLITRARNRMADTYVKENNHTHGIFIDADIGWDSRDVIAMLEMDENILGVPCSKKSVRWDRVQNAIVRRVLEWSKANAAVYEGQDVGVLTQQFLTSGQAYNPVDLPKIGGDFVANFPNDWNGMINLGVPEPMKHVGTGLLMIKREVFLKFMKAYPDRWYESRHDKASNPGRIHDFFKAGVNPETREYDSEDYWFIHDCIQLGYKALLAGWIRTTHFGSTMFYGDMPAALATSGTIF